MMLMAHIVSVKYCPGDSKTPYNESDVDGWLEEGYILVRKPRFPDDCFVLHRPSRVEVEWIYQGRSITDDKKGAIMRAYSKKREKPMKRFAESDYNRFVKDLKEGKIVAYFSKYRYGDIFFRVK